MTSNGLGRTLWAARELRAHPGSALAVVCALALLTTLVAGGLLLSQALTATTARLLDQGPDLVVRRVSPSGWQPVDVQDAALALAVPGITAARPRIWGTVKTPEQTVTVVAADEAALQSMLMPGNLRPPAPGDAIAGQGVTPSKNGNRLLLQGATDLVVRVVQRFPSNSDLVTYDVVMLHPRDLRTLLGLDPDQASDLALSVFHPEEAAALQPDLVRALPWPVHITTRLDTRKAYAAAFGRRGGLGSVLYLPAALALVLLTAAVIRHQMGDRARMGLLKALGWTGRDILTLQVTKALLVSLPAVAVGLVTAYGLVYGPTQSWVGRLFLGWDATPPLLHLDAGYAAPIFLEVSGLLLVPLWVAVLIASLGLASSDPQDLLNQGG
jgi:hypothetical protein